ncbi:MAG: hypothetical protein ACRD1L_14155 [Terriglobales bacterium]
MERAEFSALAAETLETIAGRQNRAGPPEWHRQTPAGLGHPHRGCLPRGQLLRGYPNPNGAAVSASASGCTRAVALELGLQV